MKMIIHPIKLFVIQVVAICILLILVTSCEYNELIEGENSFTKDDINGKYYITLTLTVPNTTRSNTTQTGSSSDGTIAGTSLESSLQNAQLFFCVEHDIVASFTAYYPTLTDLDDENKYDKTYTVTAYIDDINKLKDLAGEEVELYVVGNFDTLDHNLTSSNTNISVDNATFKIDGLESSPIGDFGSSGKRVPLVNSQSYIIQQFGDINITDPETILDEIKNLFIKEEGSVAIWEMEPPLELERAVARIDWADGSAGKNWIYPVGSENSDIKVQLYELQPFNVNSESYLFRHTASGTSIAAGNNVELFGSENGGGETYTWIASSDWGQDEKSLLNTTITDKSNADENIKVIIGIDDADNDGKILINDLQKRTPYPDNNKNYYSWRYVPENTVKSNKIDFTKNATGLAIKFRVLDKDNKPLTPTTENGKIPSGIEKVTPEDDRKTIKITNPADQTWITVDYIAGTANDGSDSGYFITYYVYVVHNHAQEGVISPMEYAVVRNNVYQLNVNKISGLPNPDIPSDEYLSLEIRVLSWAKRVIHVEW